jgi:hypothetical protein
MRSIDCANFKQYKCRFFLLSLFPLFAPVYFYLNKGESRVAIGDAAPGDAGASFAASLRSKQCDGPSFSCVLTLFVAVCSQAASAVDGTSSASAIAVILNMIFCCESQSWICL